MKILLIDDDLFLRDMYATKFVEMHHMVDTTDLPSIAISKLKKESYDVVLIDKIMPEMDGIDLLRKITTEKLGGSPLCIMLTNQSEWDDFENAKKAGAIGYIVKAEHIPSTVVTEVERIVNEHKNNI